MMELQELTKIKVLSFSNVLVDLDSLVHPLLHVGRMGRGVHHLLLVQVSVIFNHSNFSYCIWQNIRGGKL